MATQQEVMKAFMKSLDETELSGRDALDEAIQASSNFKSYSEVLGKFEKDRDATGDNWHRFLVEKCGIILDNKDTGAVSGSDAGGATAKGADDIIPEKGEAKYPEGSSFTVDGLTIYGIPPKEELTEDQQYIVQGLYSWWIRDALALLKESYGLTFTEEGTTNARMQLQFYESTSSNILALVQSISHDNKNYESRILKVNMAKFKDMSWDNRRGITSGTGQSLDRTLVHELTHGIMYSNIKYVDDLPLPIIEGGTAEIIHGIDDEDYAGIVYCVKDKELFTNLARYLDPRSAGVDMGTIPYEGGYIFMRYFLKQAADTTFDYDTYQKKVTVDSDSFATNYFDKVTMTGSKAADTITNSGSKVSINAKNGADLIKNYSSDVTIKTGSGNDTISNEGSNVKITSGAGNDSITNTGSAVKIDTGAGTDLIVNVGSNVKITSGAGNDSIVNSGSDVKINAGAGDDLIVTDASNVKINAGAGSDNISVYSGTSNVSAYGEKGDDYISNEGVYSAIYGGAGSDSILNTGASSVIYGDKGNDLIVNGSAENNTIAASSNLYGGAGKDSITNYAVESFISANSGNDKIENSGTRSTLYGDAGNDSIENKGSSSSIYSGDGSDYIQNSGSNSTLDGGKGNDSLKNTGDSSSIYGGDGGDSLINSGKMIYIAIGAGDDSINNSGAEVTIFGGAGNDSLYNEGSDVYFYGDTGNDYIENDGGKHMTYNFGEGFGNDTVVGFNANDTIQITSGGYSAVASGDDIIISVGNDSMLLKNAASMEINFISAAGESELWFAEENNFATTANLNAIVKNNSPATYLDNTDYKNLAQENDLSIYPNVEKT